jgi:valyl-tRNA synthetase
MIPAADSRVEIVDGHARAASVPSKCPKCGSSKLRQDNDVLDTWFSSALWPFSTLGWPDDTEDLRTYYPTSLLISGYDILFFWDARMIMMGLHLMPAAEASARIPFRSLYLHSLVRTAEGAKMSKTKGTGVDPLQLTEQYGTDALRYMLASMAAPGTDIILSEDRILGARAFANKIWNAARFLFVNLEKAEAQGISLDEIAAPGVRAAAPYELPSGSLIHRWIFSRLAVVIEQVNDALQNFRFHEACQTIYHFFWGDFCDWYIEWVKPELISTDRNVAVAAWRNIFSAVDAALRLLHPVMPFLTEELWHRLPQPEGARSIALDRFPDPRANWADAKSLDEFSALQEAIVAARNIRAEMKIDAKRMIPAEFSSRNEELRDSVERNLNAILRLASLSSLKVSSKPLESSGGMVRSAARFDLKVAFDEAVDKAAEAAKVKKEIEQLAKDIDSKRARLADEVFRAKAPAKIVTALEATLEERTLEHQKLLERLKEFS